MFPLKYNTASQELPLGKFVDSTDGDTAETGLTIANTDIKLHKSGATTLANKNSGGATHISGGDYYCVLDATDTNTYGPMKVTVHVAGALYVQVWCLVMEANAYDALMAVLGTGYLEADARLISGDSAAADNAESFFDGTGYAGTNNVIPTVTTLTNKTGFSLAATGLDAISQAATGMVEIAKAIWDRVLTGATHNIADSAGRRIRNLQEFGTYEGGAVFINTVGGAAGTTDYESGTNLNPVDSIADANTIAASLTLSRFAVTPGSSITFAASQDNQVFSGEGWTLALGGQSISDSHILEATVSGVCSGVNAPEFHFCHINSITIPPTRFHNCEHYGTVTLPVGDVDFHDCAGESGFILDFGAAVANTTVILTNFSGEMVVDNLGQNGTDVLNIRGHGKITLNASCVGGTINWDGHFTIINNGSGITINSDDISSNVDSLVTSVAGLNDISAAEVNTECDTALSDYGTTAITESYATDGSAATPEQMLYMIWASLSEFAISGTTITAKKLDGSTAMTFTLDDGTDPTSRTRAT